ncbi:hypothetical protein GCM10020331_074330 [Ectobacillus funiculus]
MLTTVKKDGDTLNVIVQQDQSAQPQSIDDMLATQVPTATGATMPLSELVKVEKKVQR